MANTYCHDGYCNLENSNKEINHDKLIVVGYIAFVVAFSFLVLYEASIGIYIDPASVM